ncbi:MAG: cell division protein FtsA [Candidatus Gottesmanbacteria bacterium]
MAKDKILVGIDIGTSKIATLIGTSPIIETPEKEVNVIGISTVPSRGIRKGQVVDIEEATQAITESLEAAERMAGYSVSSAYISVGGNHIASQNSHGVVAVAEPEKEINMLDVERVIDAAKAVSLPSSREILHILPRGYVVDSQEGIKDPIGMTGVRLEVDTHLITGGSTALRNLSKCVQEVGVNVEGLVFSGLAASWAVLSETEKELGTVLVDIGGGTTDISIYVEGSLAHSSVIPIGAKNITNDLAIGLRVSLESAEKIKLIVGEKPKQIINIQEKEQKQEDEIDLSSLGLTEDVHKVSRKTLIEGIIKPRLNEIFTMVGLEIKKSGYAGLTPGGVVLSGGGALTIGAVEAVKRNLAMPVRIGIPIRITGLIEEILNPSFATSIGLLHYGAIHSTGNEKKFSFSGLGHVMEKIPVKGVAGKFIDLIKSFLP